MSTIQLPHWIESITPYDIAFLNHGGYDRSDYPKAGIYVNAVETMAQFSGEILEFIDIEYDELAGMSKAELCFHCVSRAVEEWCANAAPLADLGSFYPIPHDTKIVLPKTEGLTDEK